MKKSEKIENIKNGKMFKVHKYGDWCYCKEGIVYKIQFHGRLREYTHNSQGPVDEYLSRSFVDFRAVKIHTLTFEGE